MKIFRLILLLLHVIITLMLYGTLMNAYISPKIFPWFNLLSLGFPVLMTGYLILTLIWIFLRKKRSVVFLLLALIFISPVRRWINYSVPKNETADLKIITLNVKGGKFGIDSIQNFINRENPDLVFLQEDGDVAFEFKNLKRRNKVFQVSLYSNYEIVDHKEIFKGLYSENFNAYADHTDLKIKGKIYRIINVYLQPFKFEKQMIKLNGDTKEDEQKVKNIVRRLIPTFKMHQEQIDLIKKSIDSSPYPVILAGDFNSVPNSYEYYHLGKNLDDTFLKAGRGSATSFHEYKFPIRIDYIFTSKSIQPLSYKVDRSQKLSDHYPVISTFHLE